MKTNFDYVILDTAPVGMVTDTLLIGRTADLSVYVCRADYTRKAEFILVNELSENNKLPNLCVVINGLDFQKKKYGYYHATNEGGYISWYDFTKEIFRQAAAMGHPEYLPENMTVNSVTTAEYGASKAARPFNSRLDKSKLTANGFTPLPTWQDALGRYLKELDF